MNLRYKKFLNDIYLQMRDKGIKQKDILAFYPGMSTSTLNNFLKGKSVSLDTMDKVINYIDNPENWK